jgi:hypothetical protein
MRIRLDELPAAEPRPRLRIFERAAFFQALIDQSPLTVGNNLLRREMFARSGGFHPPLRRSEDREFWLRVAPHTTFAFWDEPFMLNTIHDCDRLVTNIDQMNASFASALEHVIEVGSGLSTGERRMLRRRHRDTLFSYAYQAYDRGEYREAAGRFGQLLRRYVRPGMPWLYWSLCQLPTPIIRGVRQLKQRVF